MICQAQITTKTTAAALLALSSYAMRKAKNCRLSIFVLNLLVLLSTAVHASTLPYSDVSSITKQKAFFTTSPPAPNCKLPDHLTYWKINASNPELVEGQRYGLVYESNPRAFDQRIALFFKNSQYLKQFRLEISSVVPPSNPSEFRPLQLVIRTSPVITDWTLLEWKIPENWLRKSLILRVYNTGPYHPLSEFSFSDPFDPKALEATLTARELAKFNSTESPTTSLTLAGISIIKLILFGLLWVIPGMVIVSAICLRSRIGIVLPLFSFPLLLMVNSLLAYALFATSILLPHTTSILILTVNNASILALGIPEIRGKIGELFLKNKDFQYAILLCLLAAMIGLFAGMVFGGWEDIQTASTIRYLEASLPADNQLPGIFVERLYNNLPLSPYFHGWLSSDRPALQSALILLVRTAFQNPVNDTQLFSILLQSLCVSALYVLLRAMQTSRMKSFAIALSMVFTSAFLLNSIFVWPKLLPVAYLLITTTLLFQSDSLLGEGNVNLRAVLLGIFSSLSLLSHGGSIFGLMPLFITAIFFWKLPHPKQWISMLLPFFLLMVPWVLYQKIMDPPGDRLLRWHIAGFTGTSDLGFLELLVAQYQALGWEQWVFNKTENVKVIWGDWSVAFLHLFPYQFSNHFHLLRSGMFLSFVQSLIFQLPFIVALPFLLLKKEHRATLWKHSHLLLISLLGLIIWVLMMFSPGRTILHQGTHYLPLLFIVFFVITLSKQSWRFTRLFWALQILGISVVWVFPAFPGQFAPDWIINEVHFDSTALIGYLTLTAISCYFLFRSDSKKASVSSINKSA